MGTPTTTTTGNASKTTTTAPTTGPAKTDTPTTAAPGTGTTATGKAVTADPDRGNIGNVAVEKDTSEWTSVRSKASTNPVHLAVRDAVKGEAYRIAVENDAKKIERVKRMLRSAAQNYDVGMSIHPETVDVPNTDGKRVFVRFKTGDRDHRKTDENGTATTGTATANTEKAGAAGGNAPAKS